MTDISSILPLVMTRENVSRPWLMSPQNPPLCRFLTEAGQEKMVQVLLGQGGSWAGLEGDLKESTRRSSLALVTSEVLMFDDVTFLRR